MPGPSTRSGRKRGGSNGSSRGASIHFEGCPQPVCASRRGGACPARPFVYESVRLFASVADRQSPLPVESCWREVSFMNNVRRPAHVRRSPRLREFAYDSPGAYFVTACTSRRRQILASVSSVGVLCLTEAGRIVHETWESLPARFKGVTIDAFVVMPDHIHGIVWLDDDDVKSGSDHSAPRLTDVMRAFKSISSRNAKVALGRVGSHVWQRSFYDRVIRTERELFAAREYIVNNPLAFSLKARGLIGGSYDAGGASAAPTCASRRVCD